MSLSPNLLKHEWMSNRQKCLCEWRWSKRLIKTFKRKLLSVEKRNLNTDSSLHAAPMWYSFNWDLGKSNLPFCYLKEFFSRFQGVFNKQHDSSKSRNEFKPRILQRCPSLRQEMFSFVGDVKHDDVPKTFYRQNDLVGSKQVCLPKWESHTKFCND